MFFLLQNCVASFASGCWFILMDFLLTLWQNFLSLFWNDLFYLYRLKLFQYLLCLMSIANIFWFISSSCIVRVVCSFVLAFSSWPSVAKFSLHSTLTYCWSFFYQFFQPNFPSIFLYFYSGYLGENRFHHRSFTPA